MLQHVMKLVEDMDGFDAWLRLMRKYSPKSLARAVRLVGQVTTPPKVNDITKAELQLDKWEELVKVMKKDFKEEFSDTVRVGIVTAMMPQSVQELNYQSIGTTIKYDEVVQKVRAVISNKVAMMAHKGPAHMLCFRSIRFETVPRHQKFGRILFRMSLQIAHSQRESLYCSSLVHGHA